VCLHQSLFKGRNTLSCGGLGLANHKQKPKHTAPVMAVSFLTNIYPPLFHISIFIFHKIYQCILKNEEIKRKDKKIKRIIKEKDD
jgi:hypothetical protein